MHKKQLVEPDMWRKWKPIVTDAVVRWIEEHGEADTDNDEADGGKAGRAEEEYDVPDEHDEQGEQSVRYDETDVPDAATWASPLLPEI